LKQTNWGGRTGEATWRLGDDELRWETGEATWRLGDDEIRWEDWRGHVAAW
jgi:hypothetical protein